MESDATSTASSGTGQPLKVVLAGEEGVGKTSIFIRLRDCVFHEETLSTIGNDHCHLERCLPNGTIVQVQLWDTAGVENYATLTRSYYRNAKAVIFVYSLDSSKSLERLKLHIYDAQTNEPKALNVFVCNKIDLQESKHEIRVCDVDKFLEERRVDSDSSESPMHYRISVKENTGLDQALDDVLSKIKSGLDQSTSSDFPDPNTVKLTEDKPGKSDCC